MATRAAACSLVFPSPTAFLRIDWSRSNCACWSAGADVSEGTGFEPGAACRAPRVVQTMRQQAANTPTLRAAVRRFRTQRASRAEIPAVDGDDWIEKWIKHKSGLARAATIAPPDDRWHPKAKSAGVGMPALFLSANARSRASPAWLPALPRFYRELRAPSQRPAHRLEPQPELSLAVFLRVRGPAQSWRCSRLVRRAWCRCDRSRRARRGCGKRGECLRAALQCRCHRTRGYGAALRE